MMFTYSDILNQYLGNIGMDGSTDSAILAQFSRNLSVRYQLILAQLKDYMIQNQSTTTTVAAQQFYHYPAGIVNIESAVVTIGSVRYPTTTINSQYQWDWLNSIQVQPTAIPQFIFPRKSDFGLYPIPQDAYTLTFNYHYRDRTLSVADYVVGTAAVTQNSTLVTISGGAVLTNAMIGRWFEVTDATAPGQGYFYKITAVPTSSTLTLESVYEGLASSGVTYRIGEIPAIPAEGHILLVDGTTADFYSGPKHDIATSTWFNNKFYTGDGQNSSRNFGDSKISGGLIGLYNSYTDRNSEHVIERKKTIYPFFDKNWAGTIT